MPEVYGVVVYPWRRITYSLTGEGVRRVNGF